MECKKCGKKIGIWDSGYANNTLCYNCYKEDKSKMYGEKENIEKTDGEEIEDVRIDYSESNNRSNGVATLLKTLGIIELIVMIIVALSEESLTYFIVGFVLFAFILGFSEIIYLLENIKNLLENKEDDDENEED